MDKPNVKEILASLSGVWSQNKDENLNTPNEILDSLSNDFIETKFCIGDSFKALAKTPNQDVAAIKNSIYNQKRLHL